MKTSWPYRAGQTVYWTQGECEVWGRPTEVIYPDSNHTTHSYSALSDGTRIGLLTLVTDPSGKQKRYLNDAFGRLIRVEESIVRQPDRNGAVFV